MEDIPRSKRRPPFSVVRSLAVAGTGLPLPYLPFLFVEAPTGECRVQEKVLAYARAALASRTHSSIEADVKTLARLFDFYTVYAGASALRDEDIDYLICMYLIHRYNGTLRGGNACILGGLNWTPVSYARLKADFPASSNTSGSARHSTDMLGSIPTASPCPTRLHPSCG
jgi:hypothetical protein